MHSKALSRLSIAPAKALMEEKSVRRGQQGIYIDTHPPKDEITCQHARSFSLQ